MGVHFKPIGKKSSMPAGLAAGIVTSLGSLFLGASILAWLINRQMLEEKAIGYGVMIMLIAASYLGCKVGYIQIKEKRLIISGMVGVVLMLILLSVTALVFDGQYSGVGATGLLVLCGCCLAVLLGGSKKGIGKGYKFKKPTR